MKTKQDVLAKFFQNDDINIIIAAIEKANAERKAICLLQLESYENEKQAKKLAEKESENPKGKKRK